MNDKKECKCGGGCKECTCNHEVANEEAAVIMRFEDSESNEVKEYELIRIFNYENSNIFMLKSLDGGKIEFIVTKSFGICAEYVHNGKKIKAAVERVYKNSGNPVALISYKNDAGMTCLGIIKEDNSIITQEEEGFMEIFRNYL